MSDNYKALVTELRDQAAWWMVMSERAESPEAKAMLDGCSRKLTCLIERRDEDGNLRPPIKAMLASPQ